ncbi:Myb-like DNA-binding domain protein [Dictyocaulus viviparus]|uniref:Myb-like DNA-binding domain protein n=1 Tax=Dictyocaulus viviparus TaxID=29172 RepID=A0A0D8XZ77_DICVI|nr:Myb-like DNA-binding domain protein [Dictyocaulus viviparus]
MRRVKGIVINHDVPICTTEWSQVEQKQLEDALQRYPKGCESRWDKIAAAIPTKTKEQCQERIKKLVELTGY